MPLPNILSMSLNLTDFLENMWQYSVSPYTDMLGDYFYITIFGVIGVALHIKSRDYLTTGFYFAVIGFFFSTVFTSADALPAATLYYLVTAFGIGLALYGFYVQRVRR